MIDPARARPADRGRRRPTVRSRHRWPSPGRPRRGPSTAVAPRCRAA